jgi:hypothetical protein
MTTAFSKRVPIAVVAVLATLLGPASVQARNTNTTIQQGQVNINRTVQYGDSNDNLTYQTGKININRTIQIGSNNRNQTGQFGWVNRNRTSQGRGFKRTLYKGGASERVSSRRRSPKRSRGGNDDDR